MCVSIPPPVIRHFGFIVTIYRFPLVRALISFAFQDYSLRRLLNPSLPSPNDRGATEITTTLSRWKLQLQIIIITFTGMENCAIYLNFAFRNPFLLAIVPPRVRNADVDINLCRAFMK